MAQTAVAPALFIAGQAFDANALIQWLVAKGISADRLEPFGRGAQALLYPDPVYAWQHEANRRVEIEVLEH